MNKKNYVPPKVKPSKKKKSEVLPEWNNDLSDLNRYKLTPAELRINSVSKNLEYAKKSLVINQSKVLNTSSNVLEEKSTVLAIKEDLSLNKSMNRPDNLNNSVTINSNNKHQRSNSAVVKSRVETLTSLDGKSNIKPEKKWNIGSIHTNRNSSQKIKMKEYHEKTVSKIKLNTHHSQKVFEKNGWVVANINTKRIIKKDQDPQEFEDEDDIIKQEPMVRITITKIEKSTQANLLNRNALRSPQLQQAAQIFSASDGFPEHDFDKNLKRLEENMKKENPKNASELKENFPEGNKEIEQDNKDHHEVEVAEEYKNQKKGDEILIENQNNEEQYNLLEDDFKKELNRLDGLEETMKKLNEIIEFSERSSMKFKYEQEQNNFKKQSIERNRYNSNENNDEESKSSKNLIQADNSNNFQEIFINPNFNTNESRTSKKMNNSNKNNQKENQVQETYCIPNYKTNESRASKNKANQEIRDEFRENISYIPSYNTDDSRLSPNKTIYQNQNYNITIPNFNTVPSNLSKLIVPVIKHDDFDEISCIPNYNTNDSKSSKKIVPVDRNIINLDNADKSFYNIHNKPSERHSNARYDNYDESTLNELDYMKDLLMKTKTDLDKFTSKFNTYSNFNSQLNYEDDEMEPRKLPNFLSNKNH